MIIFAVVGYFFVFNYHKEEDKSEVDDSTEESTNYDDYKGVWFLKGEDEDEPSEELCINIIDGSTLTFDYFVKDVAYFESQTASIEANQANFDIVDRNDEITLSGRIIFRNDKIFLVITSSSVEDISPGTIEFIEKSNDSVLENY